MFFKLFGFIKTFNVRLSMLFFILAAVFYFTKNTNVLMVICLLIAVYNLIMAILTRIFIHLAGKILN